METNDPLLAIQSVYELGSAKKKVHEYYSGAEAVSFLNNGSKCYAILWNGVALRGWTGNDYQHFFEHKAWIDVAQEIRSREPKEVNNGN